MPTEANGAELNIQQLLGHQTMGPLVREWTFKDSILYALGLGLAGDHLQFTTNNTASHPQELIPSFVSVLSQVDALRPNTAGIDTRRAVHASQSFRLHRGTVPPSGKAELRTSVREVLDKGKGAFYFTETQAVDPESREPIFTSEAGVFVVGAGGYGGERGVSTPWERPGRPPDAELSLATWISQPLLYRLNGDFNPLHSDPEFAQAAGYPRPILHGMATYGMACRALIDTVCIASGVRFMDAQFSKPVLPGETLTFRIWGDDLTGAFEAIDESGEIVLGKGRYEGHTA